MTRKNQPSPQPLDVSKRDMLMVGLWLFVLVVAAGLFLYAGYWLDTWLGTSPYFMCGLCLLAIVSMAGSYHEDRLAGRRAAPFRSFRISNRIVFLTSQLQKKNH